MSEARSFAAIGAVLAFLGVTGGAFGAHLLEDRLTAESLDVFETAVQYQMYHAMGLLVIGVFWARYSRRPLLWAGRLFVAGTVIFSGSLYLLVFTAWSWWGAVTPFGGVCLLGGWAALFWGMVTSPNLQRVPEG